MSKITEDTFENEIILPIFKELGYSVAYGPTIAPDGTNPERESYEQTILLERLRTSLKRINPHLSESIIQEAIRQLIHTEFPDLIFNNHSFHKKLTDGISIEALVDGEVTYPRVRLIDEANPDLNDWLVVNQFTISESNRTRRADLVIFLNGIPIGIFEIKSPSEEGATLKAAFNQVQTYKKELPSFFITNEILVICDGYQSRVGTLSSHMDRFMPWRTIDGVNLITKTAEELETLIRGLFNKATLLDYLLHFIVFEKTGDGLIKKAAGYHQFWAVKKAVEHTLSASGMQQTAKGDDHFNKKRIGVIWHTQGSGKSLSMAFYTGKIIRHSEMKNPTIVVITDRNDLDGQLHDTFVDCHELFRQSPIQAESRAHLKQLLNIASGGVIFTTIQKFLPEQKGETYPLLTDRSNVVVIADEAHRSQYDFIDGFARHMRDALPNASFIGFTGTPIEGTDKNTPAVFGDYIDIYDIAQAIEDGATVPILYESRLAQIELKDEERHSLDQEFEQITEGEEETAKAKLRTKWAAVEAMVGTKERIALVTHNLVEHFEERLTTLDGKAMAVSMSRHLCVEMYNAVCKLRPQWHSDNDDEGVIKIVMSGAASDHADWQQHIRSKAGRDFIAERFKNPSDPLKIVIVCDMWLTGFDCPCLHTLYIDKLMSGHNLMQAIARVNRVFRDKPGGLIVDFIGIAENLRFAIADYTRSGGRGKAVFNQEEALRVLQEKYSVIHDFFHPFDCTSILPLRGQERRSQIINAMDYILTLDDGKKRFLEIVSQLSKAFALSVPHPQALDLKDKVGLFQEIRSAIVKTTGDLHGRSPEDMEMAIKQLVSNAVVSTEIVDIFKDAGLTNPDISILSDRFLEDVQKIPKKNLAVELLQKLIRDEIKTRSKKNVVQARSFSEMLEQSIHKYRNRTIESAMVIEELVALAKDMQLAQQRGEELGLTDDEVAFYDALATNGSSQTVMGDEQLRMLAQELVRKVKQNVSIDWTLRESARARIRVEVKRLLKQYGYPPDKQEKATDLIIKQAETLCQEWSDF